MHQNTLTGPQTNRITYTVIALLAVAKRTQNNQHKRHKTYPPTIYIGHLPFALLSLFTIFYLVMVLHFHIEHSPTNKY